MTIAVFSGLISDWIAFWITGPIINNRWTPFLIVAGSAALIIGAVVVVLVLFLSPEYGKDDLQGRWRA